MRIQDIKKGEYIYHLFKGERRVGKVKYHKNDYIGFMDINDPECSWYIDQANITDGSAIVVTKETHPEHWL